MSGRGACAGLFQKGFPRRERGVAQARNDALMSRMGGHARERVVVHEGEAHAVLTTQIKQPGTFGAGASLAHIHHVHLLRLAFQKLQHGLHARQKIFHIFVSRRHYKLFPLDNVKKSGMGRSRPIESPPFSRYSCPLLGAGRGKHSCFFSPGRPPVLESRRVFRSAGMCFFSAFGACFWQRALWLVSCFCSRCKST